MTNNVWNIMEPDILDLSTTSYEFNEFRELNVSNSSALSLLSLETRDKDSFLLPAQGYLQIGFYLSPNSNGVSPAPPYNNPVDVTLQNGILSLFKNIALFIEDVQIEYLDSPGLAYTVYNLANYSSEYSKSIASQEFWYPDTADDTITKQRGSQVRFFVGQNAGLITARTGNEIFFQQ